MPIKLMPINMLSHRWWLSCFVSMLWLLIDFSIAPAHAFDPPPGQGSPGSTAGGGTRPPKDRCLISSAPGQSLTPLAPTAYLGLTTQTHPTVWVYLPETEAKILEFSLFDRQNQGLYQTQIAIPQSGGLMQIKLPEALPALSVNQAYRWTVALVCNPKRRTEDWIGQGWIQRRVPSPELDQQLKRAATNLDRSVIYHQSQYWYDAITLLLESPQSIRSTQVWTEMIQTAGFSQMADPRIQQTVHR